MNTPVLLKKKNKIKIVYCSTLLKFRTKLVGECIEKNAGLSFKLKRMKNRCAHCVVNALHAVLHTILSLRQTSINHTNVQESFIPKMCNDVTIISLTSPTSLFPSRSFSPSKPLRVMLEYLTHRCSSTHTF